MFAEVYPDSKFRLHYELHGHGPKKVLLIMGFLTDSGVWKHQWEFFEKKPEYQVCRFDNRGMNGSSAPLGLYSTSIMAEDALKLVDYLGWDTFHVIGLSMGGMIATELALKVPNRIISLALLATHTGDWNLSRPPSVGLLRTIGHVFLPPIVPFIHRRATINALKTLYGKKNLTSKWDELYEFHHQRVHDRWRTTSLHGMIGQGFAVLTHHVRQDLILKIRYSGIPTVFLVGTEDALVWTENTHAFARQLGSRPFVIQDAGHMFVVDEKDAVNKILFDHVDAIEKQFDTKFDRVAGIEEFIKNRKKQPFLDVLDLTCTHRPFCSIYILRGFFSGMLSTAFYRFLWNVLLRAYRRIVKKEPMNLHELFIVASIMDFLSEGILSGYFRAIFRSAMCIWHHYRAWRLHESQSEKMPADERPIFPPFFPFYLGIGFLWLAYRKWRS